MCVCGGGGGGRELGRRGRRGEVGATCDINFTDVRSIFYLICLSILTDNSNCKLALRGIAISRNYGAARVASFVYFGEEIESTCFRLVNKQVISVLLAYMAFIVHLL